MKVFNGTVLKSTGSWYTVMLENGEVIESRIRGSFRMKGIKNTNPIAVGDKVKISIEEGEGKGLIEELEPRKNYIIRKATNLSKRTHILAANLDQAMLVATLANPRTSTGFIDRFLVTAEAYSIPTIIVFNKSDIYSEEDLRLTMEMMALYEKLGYVTLKTSALSKDDGEKLKQMLLNKTTLIAGHSGVGKSTLINNIEPTLHLKTGDISAVHFKGTHTTTFAEMFPLSFGGFIVDTPGIKEFGIVEIEENEVGHFFPEMRDRLNDCKFDNCKHVNEPSCAIKEAVSSGEIALSRYENYLNIIGSIEKPDYKD